MKPEWIQELTARLAPLRLRPEREADIVAELAEHLDDQVHDSSPAEQNPKPQSVRPSRISTRQVCWPGGSPRSKRRRRTRCRRRARPRAAGGSARGGSTFVTRFARSAAHPAFTAPSSSRWHSPSGRRRRC